MQSTETLLHTFRLPPQLEACKRLDHGASKLHSVHVAQVVPHWRVVSSTMTGCRPFSGRIDDHFGFAFSTWWDRLPVRDDAGASRIAEISSCAHSPPFAVMNKRHLEQKNGSSWMMGIPRLALRKPYARNRRNRGAYRRRCTTIRRRASSSIASRRIGRRAGVAVACYEVSS